MAYELTPIIKYMTLDLATTNNFDFVKAMQGDDETRYVYITLLDDGLPYVIPDGAIVIRGTKPDGTGVFNYCTLSDDGKVIVELTDQMLAVAGISNYEIALFGETEVDKDTHALSSFQFRIVVEKSSIDAEVITSSNEFKVMNEAIGNAEFLRRSMDFIREAKESALQSKEAAAISEANAKTSEENAKTSETNASTSAIEAENQAKLSKSYAIGTDGEVRENDATDNSKYYYQQVKDIADDLTKALIYMGTVQFEDLELQEKKTGYVYNISNEFITTDSFKEGIGHEYPIGTNVAWTDDGYWDCLAGISFGNTVEITSPTEPEDQDVGEYWNYEYE